MRLKYVLIGYMERELGEWHFGSDYMLNQFIKLYSIQVSRVFTRVKRRIKVTWKS